MDRSDLCRKRLETFLLSAKQLHDGDVEVLHRTRVASRRLRELVPLLGLDRHTARKLGERLRKTTKRLGKVRELDVMVALIGELSRGREYPVAELKEVGAGVADERTAARERLAEKLTGKKLAALAAKVEHAAETSASKDAKHRQRRGAGPRHGWLLALEARVTRRASQLLSAIDTASTMYVAERLHSVRIALKKFRYATELLVEARNPRASRNVETLKKVQDLLGDLHDRELLIERALRLQASVARRDLTAAGRLGELAKAIEDDCRRLHARYMQERDNLIAIAERLGGTRRSLGEASGRAAKAS